MSKIELPHGAFLDPTEGKVHFPLGQITFNFTLEEWMSFAEYVDDINTVLQMNTVENVVQCPACNTISTFVEYEEPDEADIN